MTASIVRIHGRLFARIEPTEDDIIASETHCTCQTCGTTDGIVPTDWEYEDITPEQAQASVPNGAKYWKAWWDSPAREREMQCRRDLKIERKRRRERFEQDQEEKLNTRKRAWATQAMRCGLPNPYPHLSVTTPPNDAVGKQPR